MQLVFEETTNVDVLLKYFNIREKAFRQDLGIKNFDGGKDRFDHDAKILAIKVGSECIGGVRLNGCVRHGPGLLPMEAQGVDVVKHCGEFINQDEYCQWSRLVVLPEYRAKFDPMEFLEALSGFARSLGYKFIFFVCGVTQLRLYKRVLMKGGYHCEMLEDVCVPTEPGFEDLSHVVGVARIDKRHVGSLYDELLDEAVA